MKFLRIVSAYFAILYCSSLTTNALSAPTMPVDSVGREVVNGQVFILHKMNPKQTLFAVTRQYNISIHELRAANPGMPDQVKVGQVIRVPSKQSVAATTPVTTEKAPSTSQSTGSATSGQTVHTVAEGETLYRIAVKYGVLMADVRKWNSLTSDNVVLGQKLIVSEGASENKPVTPEPKKVVSVPTTTETDKKPEAAPEKVVKPAETAPVKPVSGKQIKENGLAEIIDTGESSNKFLALHRTAPVGTLVQVTNEFNNESIWVKVIGRIPDTSVNEEVLIKLSSRAFEKISPNTRRFRAQISYVATK